MGRDVVGEILRRAGIREVPHRQLLGVGALVCLVLAWGLWRWWPRSESEMFAPAGKAETGSGGARDGAADASGETSSPLVVHVVGAVRHPGVYELPPGSRVADAVEAAGGALGSAAQQAVNLARLLADGEQIALPTRDEWEASGGAGEGAAGTVSGPGSGTGGKVDLNAADEAALDALPGIGPATARRIVEDRAANGPFTKPEDLQRVSGIGQKKFDALKDLVTVR